MGGGPHRDGQTLTPSRLRARARPPRYSTRSGQVPEVGPKAGEWVNEAPEGRPWPFGGSPWRDGPPEGPETGGGRESARERGADFRQPSFARGGAGRRCGAETPAGSRRAAAVRPDPYSSRPRWAMALGARAGSQLRFELPLAQSRRLRQCSAAAVAIWIVSTPTGQDRCVERADKRSTQYAPWQDFSWRAGYSRVGGSRHPQPGPRLSPPPGGMGSDWGAVTWRAVSSPPFCRGEVRRDDLQRPPVAPDTALAGSHRVSRVGRIRPVGRQFGRGGSPRVARPAQGPADPARGTLVQSRCCSPAQGPRW